VVSRSGEVTGGLFFGHALPGRFTARHEELLVGIAGQAAVAIDNARLFEAAQRELVERRRAEEELRESEDRFRRIADSTPVAMWVTRLDRKRDFVNQAYVDFLGIPRAAAAEFDWRTIIHPQDRVRIVAQSNGGDANPRTARAIGSASVGADRAATLTQRLLAFSRRQPLAPKAIDPNALVAGMTDLLHRTIGETIEVETRLSAGIWRIEADPHQLESAILNLAVNARDAMPDGGRLVIETSAARVEAAAANGRKAR